MHVASSRLGLAVMALLVLAGCSGNPLKKSSVPTHELQQKIRQAYNIDGVPTPSQDAALLFKDVCLAALGDSGHIRSMLQGKSTYQYKIIPVDAESFVHNVPNAARLPLTDNNWYVENLQSGQRYFIILSRHEQCILYTNQPSAPLAEEFDILMERLASALKVEIAKQPSGVSFLTSSNLGALEAYRVSAWDDRIDGAYISLVVSTQPGGLSMYSFSQHPDKYSPGLKYTPHYIRKKDRR